MKRQRVFAPSSHPEHDLFQQTLFEACCRHLVFLKATFTRRHAQESPREIVCSAFVMLVGDRWLLVTAGHFLKDVHDRIKSGEFEEPQGTLASFFNPEATTGLVVPFPFFSFHQVFVNDFGLDIGFIFVDHLYQEWLKADRVIPIEKKHLAPVSVFDNFFLVGFPWEITTRANTDALAPVIMSASLLDAHALNADPNNVSRFVAQISVPIDFNIAGMSGCPIFGVTLTSRKTIKYGLVACHSGWFDGNKIVVGTSIEHVWASLIYYLANGDPDNPFFKEVCAAKRNVL